MAILSVAMLVPVLWLATALFRAAGLVRLHWRRVALVTAVVTLLAGGLAMVLLSPANVSYEQGDKVLRAMLD